MSDLMSLLNRAAGTLPDGVQIRITVERDAGWVDVLRDGDEVEFPHDSDGLEADCLAALKYLRPPGTKLYRCPRCQRIREWTDGTETEYWCQVCGKATDADLIEVMDSRP
jgi:hypothetical protein